MAQKIQSIKAEPSLNWPAKPATRFLFRLDRNALIKAKPVLIELQAGLLFLLPKANEQTKLNTEVDHFIPFARYANDLGT